MSSYELLPIPDTNAHQEESANHSAETLAHTDGHEQNESCSHQSLLHEPEADEASPTQCSCCPEHSLTSTAVEREVPRIRYLQI